MQYYLWTNAILVLSFASFIFLIFTWIKKYYTLKETLIILLFSISISFIFKFTFSDHFFGLEYEDSYIFSFSARQISNGVYPISFLTDGISYGSISNPYSTSTYGGHFITYPVFLSWFYYILGYNIFTPTYVNTLIEFLSILTLSFSFRIVIGSKRFWFLPGLIYSIAPAMNLFGTAHLSETFSSFIILLCIVSLFQYNRISSLKYLIVFGIFFLLALMIKRENTLLFSIIFLYSIYKYFEKDNKRFSGIPILLISAAILLIYYYFIQNIFEIEKNESIEISSNTFRFSYTLRLIPIFIEALLTFKWFNVYLVLLVLSGGYIILEKKKKPLQLFLIALFISYFFIYTFHYRSYYFLHFDNVHPFDALRYLNNFFIISVLFISYFLSNIIIKSISRRIFYFSLTIILLISYLNTTSMRKYFHEIESENRFSNPSLVLNFLRDKEESILIADNILVFQLLGNESLEMLDLFIWDEIILHPNRKSVYLFITDFSKSSQFKYRYPNTYNLINKSKKEEVMVFENGDILYRII